MELEYTPLSYNTKFLWVLMNSVIFLIFGIQEVRTAVFLQVAPLELWKTGFRFLIQKAPTELEYPHQSLLLNEFCLAPSGASVLTPNYYRCYKAPAGLSVLYALKIIKGL